MSDSEAKPDRLQPIFLPHNSYSKQLAQAYSTHVNACLLLTNRKRLLLLKHEIFLVLRGSELPKLYAVGELRKGLTTFLIYYFESLEYFGIRGNSVETPNVWVLSSFHPNVSKHPPPPQCLGFVLFSPQCFETAASRRDGLNYLHAKWKEIRRGERIAEGSGSEREREEGHQKFRDTSDTSSPPPRKQLRD